jgi:uncharacterized protein
MLRVMAGPTDPRPTAAAAVWREAIDRFEAGAYWEAHEVLEPRWLVARGTERELAAGFILLAAALHKAHVVGQVRGGRRNYAKALRHLALVPDMYGGVDVRTLEARVHAALGDPGRRPQWPGAVPVEEGDAA